MQHCCLLVCVSVCVLIGIDAVIKDRAMRRGVRGVRDKRGGHKPALSSFNNLEVDGKLKMAIDEEKSGEKSGRKRGKRRKKKAEDAGHFYGFTFERLDVDKHEIAMESPRSMASRSTSGSTLAIPTFGFH